MRQEWRNKKRALKAEHKKTKADKMGARGKVATKKQDSNPKTCTVGGTRNRPMNESVDIDRG